MPAKGKKAGENLTGGCFVAEDLDRHYHERYGEPMLGLARMLAEIVHSGDLGALQWVATNFCAVLDRAATRLGVDIEVGE